MNKNNIVPNNKYKNCPAFMEDGRLFTDYRSSHYVDKFIQAENKIMNSFEYRMFLTRNGSQIINKNNDYIQKEYACSPCTAKTMPMKEEISFDWDGNMTVKPIDPNGMGIYHPTDSFDRVEGVSSENLYFLDKEEREKNIRGDVDKFL
jgi:hypothetical protein